jgi:hypothetical protein
VRSALVLIVVAGCGLLPADPPQQPTVVDTDAADLAHTWKIADHALARQTSLTEADAAALHGRAIQISATSYTTPWHGTCEQAGHTRRTRILADVASELGVDRTRIARFQLAPDVVQYQLSCADPTHRALSVTLFVSKARALTCFNGVCYLLTH